MSQDVTVTANFIAQNPPTIITDDATSITQTSATFNGEITDTGGQNVTTVHFLYIPYAVLQYDSQNNINPGPDIKSTQNITGSFGVGQFSAAVSGLDCGVQYLVAAQGTNSAGDGGGDATALFTTLPCGNQNNTSSGSAGVTTGGGRTYICMDPKATNYDTYYSAGNTHCNYSLNTSVQTASKPVDVPAASSILGTGTCPANLVITENLKQGAHDGIYNLYTQEKVTQVSILQAHINRILAASYKQAAGPTDGVFGKLTKQGVQRLQTALNTILKPAPLLKVDGVVGSFTRAAINDSCGNK